MRLIVLFYHNSNKVKFTFPSYLALKVISVQFKPSLSLSYISSVFWSYNFIFTWLKLRWPNLPVKDTNFVQLLLLF